MPFGQQIMTIKKNEIALPSIPTGKLNNLDKRITALEQAPAGGTILTAGGIVDDTNVAFTFSSLPTVININGMEYIQTGGAITWTWNAGTLTATLSSPVGVGGSIFGSGTPGAADTTTQFTEGYAYSTLFQPAPATSILLPNVSLYKINFSLAFLQTISFPNLTTVTDVINVSSSGALASFSAPLLTAATSITFSDDVALTALNLNSLTSTNIIISNIGLASLSLPSYVGILVTTFSLTNCNNLTTLNLSAMTMGTVAVTSSAALTSVNLSSYIGDASYGPALNISNNSALTTITISSSTQALSFNLSGNALSQASVDAILLALDTAGHSGGFVDVSGGTSAAPSVTGAGHVTSLQGKGWTVTTN